MSKPRKKSAYPKGRQIDPVAVDYVRGLLGGRSRQRDLLIEHLHLIQDDKGHLPAANLAALAREMNLAQTEVYEVATFYHHFDVVREDETPPPALTIRVCDGIACEMAGAHDLIEDLKTELGTNVRVIPAPCVGACHAAPVAVVGKRQVPHAKTASVKDTVTNGNILPDLPAYEDLDAYRRNGGYKVLGEANTGTRTAESLIEEIEKAGLRGMGGAGFPTARKWRFMEKAGKPRVLAINGDEGEPGTFKDRHCLETAPHRVLEGALLTAKAIEAEDIYIYLRDEYPQVHDLLHREIDAVVKAGLAEGVTIHLRRGAGAYICGEEGGMLESIEGKRGLPRNRPPYPAQRGLFGRPTVINNIETMYWVSQILTNGADWYQDQGRPHFYSVSGRVKKPGVVQAPSGVTVRQLIEDHCGGMADGHSFKAYLPGGASGGILPAELGDEPLDFRVLEKYGCFVGSAAVVVLSDKDDIRDVVLNLLRFFADESCGQCTPCRVGCEKMVRLLEQRDWDRDLMTELSQTMRDASICGLGQAAPNPVLAAFKFFEGDVS